MVFAKILTVHVWFTIKFNLDVISVDLVLLLVQMEIVLKLYARTDLSPMHMEIVSKWVNCVRSTMKEVHA